MLNPYDPGMTRITWADTLMKPELGFRSIFVRAAAVAAATYSVAIVPLVYTDAVNLITHPLIVSSSIGIAWVSSMSFIIVWTKQMLDEAHDKFSWATEGERAAFFAVYIRYMNNHLMSVLLGLFGWTALMIGIYVLVYAPSYITWLLPPIGKPIDVQPDQRAVFMVSVGIVTLVAAIMAMTAARYLRGQAIYASALRRYKYRYPMAALRQHLDGHISNTGYAGLAFSTGIAVILFALDLNAKNIIVVESAICVVIIAGLSYVFVIKYCEQAYQLAANRAQLVFQKSALTGNDNLLRELASLASYTLCTPLVSKLTIVKTLFSITAPLLIRIFEPQLRTFASFISS